MQHRFDKTDKAYATALEGELDIWQNLTEWKSADKKAGNAGKEKKPGRRFSCAQLKPKDKMDVDIVPAKEIVTRDDVQAKDETDAKQVYYVFDLAIFTILIST